MSEMAQTADHIIVLGRGRVIADAPVGDILAARDRQRRARAHTACPTCCRNAARRPGRDRHRHGAQTCSRSTVSPRPRSASSPPQARNRAARTHPDRRLARGGLPAAHRRRRRIPRRRTRDDTATRTAPIDRAQHCQASPSRGILRSEWIKLRSLRSTCGATSSSSSSRSGSRSLLALAMPRRAATRRPRRAGLCRQPASAAGDDVGIGFGQLVVAVLGALVITGEYATGMIRSTFTAVPKRIPALFAQGRSSSAVDDLRGRLRRAVAEPSRLASAVLATGDIVCRLRRRRVLAHPRRRGGLPRSHRLFCAGDRRDHPQQRRRYRGGPRARSSCCRRS